MLDKLVNSLDFQSRALMLRAERQRVLASNIANADTPGYTARDYKFGDALRTATGQGSSMAVTMAPSQTSSRHMELPTIGSLNSDKPELGYSVAAQPSLDGNSVDMDRERANFVDNTVRYEAALRFINGQAKTMLSAIQGQ